MIIVLALRYMTCNFSAVQVLSSILFALMAVVLPMAGMQQYVCVMGMEFSASVDDCPMTEKDCENRDREIPDCMIASDLIPDAELPSLGQISVWNADQFHFLRLDIEELVGADSVKNLEEFDRGPPDVVELYVKQQRLLI